MNDTHPPHKVALIILQPRAWQHPDKVKILISIKGRSPYQLNIEVKR